MTFTNRLHAGVLLGEALSSDTLHSPLVLGLARGGVVVACAIAARLHAPVDVLVVKKIPAPGQSELAIGAVTPDGPIILDENLASSVGATQRYIEEKKRALHKQIKERVAQYRSVAGQIPLDGHDIVIVDDGAATGATMEGAIAWARHQGAHQIIVALPIASEEVTKKLQLLAEAVIVLSSPKDFFSVGQFYKEFGEVRDEQVVALLKIARKDTKIREEKL